MARKRKMEDGGSAVDAPSSTDTAAPDGLSSRRKKSTAQRIGRACDRCQHRKLACGPAPEGCPPCVRVNAWCTVTDPLTGNPTYRGEFEYLEHQVAKQRQDIEELLAKLQSLGADVGPYLEDDPATKQYLAWTQVKATGDTRPWDRDGQLAGSRHSGPQQTDATGAVPGPAAGMQPTEAVSTPPASTGDPFGLPDLRTGIAGRNYLGISPSTSPSSSSKLNMFGWEINLSSFTGDDSADESDEPAVPEDKPHGRSYQSFLDTVFGVHKVPRPTLPSKQDSLQYASSFMSVLNAFLPLLHKSSFMKLLCRVYDDRSFRSNAAEDVMVHMMLASMLYQDAVRNWEDPARQADLHRRSDIHYHYSLTRLPQLLAGHAVADLQALALICAHVRNFPKPEASWVIVNLTFNKMIEQGYHRASKPGSGTAPAMSVLELEMRKRVFWSVLAIHVTVSGKLGRPMALREEDYDVDLPMAIDDDLLSAEWSDTSKPGKCLFVVGLEIFKFEPLVLDLYRTMYAVKRSPKEYAQFIGTAERRLRAWMDGWPSQFREPDAAGGLTRIFAELLHGWAQEFRLILHHPSLSMTKSAQFNAMNLRTCLDASRQMLQHAKVLQQAKGLDTTWYNCAVYILAIQTTLYGHGQLKDELDESKLELLKADMSEWLSIMGDIGVLLDSGRRLRDTIRKQIESGMSQLEQHVADKSNATPLKQEEDAPAEKTVNSVTLPIVASRQDNYDGGGYEGYTNAGLSMNGYGHTDEQPHDGPLEYPAVAPDGQSIGQYASMASYGYSDPSGSVYNRPVAMASHYGTPTYPVNLAAEELAPAYQHRAHAGSSSSMQAMYVPANPGYHHVNTYGPDSQSWYQYTQTIPTGVGRQDYHPATALLQLGGRSDAVIGGGVVAADGAENADMEAGGGGGQLWPLTMDQHLGPTNNLR